MVMPWWQGCAFALWMLIAVGVVVGPCLAISAVLLEKLSDKRLWVRALSFVMIVVVCVGAGLVLHQLREPVVVLWEETVHAFQRHR